MSQKIPLSVRTAGFMAGAILLGALAGCLNDGAGPRAGYQGRTTGRMQAAVYFEDDYDYYPAYEVYYSRNRHEYVYRDGNSWVRRSQPQGIELNVLLAAPSVRVDFRDSPEQHHGAVVKSYPKNWKQPAKSDGQPERKDEKKNDKKDRKDDRSNDKDDRKDDRRQD